MILPYFYSMLSRGICLCETSCFRLQSSLTWPTADAGLQAFMKALVGAQRRYRLQAELGWSDSAPLQEGTVGYMPDSEIILPAVCPNTSQVGMPNGSQTHRESLARTFLFKMSLSFLYPGQS